MSGEMDHPGNRPASGKRGDMQEDRFEDYRCAHRGRRRTLVTEFADGTDGWQVVLRVRVGPLDGGYHEQRKGNGRSHPSAHTRM